MISVVDKEIIRRLYQKQGKSMRWIARELKMSRKTVRKAIFDDSEPKYNLAQPKPKPITDKIHPIKNPSNNKKMAGRRKRLPTKTALYS